MTSDASEPQAPGLIDAVRAEQVRLLYGDGFASLASTLTISVVLAGLLVWQRTLDPIAAAVWLAGMVLQTGIKYGLYLAYQRAQPPVAAWPVWGRRAVASNVVGGLVWAGGMPLLLGDAPFELQGLVISVLIGGTYGLIGSAGAYMPAFSTFFLPFVGIIGWLGTRGDVLHGAAAAILVIWLPSVAILARRYNRRLEEALTLRFEKALLAEDLAAQKAIADQTNLAKSRFLAAASHDLRQPVHALGMFIGALRSHRLPRRSVELVDQMDASISALDGLFGSLLDISRLDAGVIESKPEAVSVQPLLARICRELEPEAAAKGVDLILVPTTAVVRSDPVLLERVMRNLIGNAVRYTARGWVLVGCRRRGRRFCLEVRDTGPGIAPEHHEAVFEEFFQVANPDRDRAKGLGLGLPIVRRLTAILDHTLEMESAAGKGTTFRVLAARGVQRVAAPFEVRPGVLVDLPTGLILAIDDEQAIRAGMAALLESWGHRVIAVSGGDEAMAAVDGGARPDLIICDYRLRDGENGADAIARVRAALDAETPALLVTGDTAPENIRNALASGYPLLHKPLNHARLRAAVSNLMRSKRPLAIPAE